MAWVVATLLDPTPSGGARLAVAEASHPAVWIAFGLIVFLFAAFTVVIVFVVRRFKVRFDAMLKVQRESLGKDGAGDETGLEARIEQVGRQIQETTSDSEREKLEELLGRLRSGMASGATQLSVSSTLASGVPPHLELKIQIEGVPSPNTPEEIQRRSNEIHSGLVMPWLTSQKFVCPVCNRAASRFTIKVSGFDGPRLVGAACADCAGKGALPKVGGPVPPPLPDGEGEDEPSDGQP